MRTVVVASASLTATLESVGWGFPMILPTGPEWLGWLLIGLGAVAFIGFVIAVVTPLWDWFMQLGVKISCKNASGARVLKPNTKGRWEWERRAYWDWKGWVIGWRWQQLRYPPFGVEYWASLYFLCFSLYIGWRQDREPGT